MEFKKWLICGAALCAAFNATAQGAPNIATPDAVTMAAPQGAHRGASRGAQRTVPRPTTALPFYNLHTKQSIVIHHARGQAVSAQTNHFMRDFRRNEPANMDSRLFDLLVDLKAAINKRYPHLSVRFETISAYRAPQTNAMLRQSGGGQASQSRHMHGDAIDIRVPGVKTKDLRDIATCMRRGGVGYYAQDGFVHVDVSRVRYWPSHDYLAKLKCP